MTARNVSKQALQAYNGSMQGSGSRLTLKSLLDVHRLLRARLEVRYAALALAERLRPLARDDPPLLAHIHLVAQHHEGEALGVHRTGLYQELIPPAVQRVEALLIIHVVHQHAAIRSPIERHAQALKALLPRCVPQLHGHESVIHEHFFGEEIGADGRFVGGRELLVDLCNTV